MKTTNIIALAVLCVALAPSRMVAIDKAIENALVEVLGNPSLVVRGDIAEMELPAASGRKKKVYVGRMVTYNFGDQTAMFLLTQSGSVKVFVVQCKSPLDYIQIQDLRRVVVGAIGDSTIKVNVTHDQRRFEAVSALHADEQ